MIDYTPHLTGPGNGPDSSQEEAENTDWEKYYATPDEWQKMKINPTDPHMPVSQIGLQQVYICYPIGGYKSLQNLALNKNQVALSNDCKQTSTFKHQWIFLF